MIFDCLICHQHQRWWWKLFQMTFCVCLGCYVWWWQDAFLISLFIDWSPSFAFIVVIFDIKNLPERENSKSNWYFKDMLSSASFHYLFNSLKIEKPIYHLISIVTCLISNLITLKKSLIETAGASNWWKPFNLQCATIFFLTTMTISVIGLT